MTTDIRPPSVAGTFYPAHPIHLRNMLEDFLSQVPPAGIHNLPKAIIAPHAGYIYSGPIAASAYACLENWAPQSIQQVVLLGPAHRYPLFGIAGPESHFFATPLGEVPINNPMLQEVAQNLPHIELLEAAHHGEHSLEVQLPFLQYFFGYHFQLIPFVIGQIDPSTVVPILEYLWGGDETLIVISSDLSHYQTYRSAQLTDQKTAQEITSLNPDAIGWDDACGRVGIRALLAVAQKKKLISHCIDLRNSGDTAGDKDQVVGYGAFHFLSGE